MERLPQINRFAIAICYLFMITILFFSCDSESLNEFDIQNESVSNRAISEFYLINLEEYTSCESVCIDSETNTFFAASGKQTKFAGPNAKEVSYKAYNTSSNFVVEVTYLVISGKSKTKSDITVNINGNIVTFNGIASGTTVKHIDRLPKGWSACDLIPFNILQEGLSSPISFSENYSLVGACPDCDEEFDYKLNKDGSYTFSYSGNSDVENAVIKFTCPHISDFESLDDKEYGINQGNENGSPTVLSWEGSLNACEITTFRLKFTADCEQTNSGFTNLFTDFKVNDISKKGDLESIIFECSE